MELIVEMEEQLGASSRAGWSSLPPGSWGRGGNGGSRTQRDMPEDDTFVTYARSFQAGRSSAFTLPPSCFPVDNVSEDLPLSREWGHTAQSQGPLPPGKGS